MLKKRECYGVIEQFEIGGIIAGVSWHQRFVFLPRFVLWELELLNTDYTTRMGIDLTPESIHQDDCYNS